MVPSRDVAAGADRAELASRLRLGVTRLARRLRQQADPGLSPTLLSALATVECHGPLTLGALAEHEQVAAPTVTRVVERLVAEGLVSRGAAEGDRRVRIVEVTGRGRATLESVRRRKAAWLSRRLDELGPEDVAALAAAVDVLERLAGDEAP